MNLKQLEHLLAVADARSFSRAALRLHITQPALSRSIRLLEEVLGAKLIDRMGRRNELTPLGETVAARARQLLFGAEELRRSVDMAKKGNGGPIRIGLGSGPAAVLMTPFMVHMARLHPQVPVNIMRGALDLQLGHLRARAADALVIDRRAVPPADDLVVEMVAELRAGFICRSGHPLLARGADAYSFDDILPYPIASTTLTDEIGNQLMRQYGPRANPNTAVGLRCEEMDSLIATVRQTDVVFFGIVAAARQGLVSGELVELPVRPVFGAKGLFALITLAGRTESPSLQLFRQFVTEHMHD
ncbi:LysR family transcriptional regulator [Pseudorhodoferax sp. Leaf265]|uniref:LysR family transcriptional regulator n=1 Tax=Pseudorhodoferax sp. Leaf265 TaxID=1736315 RepID=UPI0006FC221C|nr:LysR family transcriptional regulator [Pseudorhodoferax sp. Leaf265]KQP06321.1 LysR family transcriptional regulator [Pseudorhodoferax sp. Leaf265]